jgi:adenosine deaminase
MKTKLITLFAALVASVSVGAHSNNEQNAAKYFNSIKANPDKLETFLYVMPKGGDLHNHDMGSTMAENLMQYALEDKWCINQLTFAVYKNPSCAPAYILKNAADKPAISTAITEAWSMLNFKPDKETGHEHFFNAFDKFSAAAAPHLDQIYAEIIERAGIQNENYVELMTTLEIGSIFQLSDNAIWNPDFAALRDYYLKNGILNIVANISKDITTSEASVNKILQCGTDRAAAGCQVKLRYLYQVLREEQPQVVFAELLAGFETANRDARFLGINMVQPEDGEISMRDYLLHMQIINYLHATYPKVHISLHAGELVPGLVPPEGLRFHIKAAVNTAQAERIGHGIDITHEDDYANLLNEMAKKRVMVEINLTSNDYILNVAGKNHPLPLYIQYGVPVSLSTDDEGVDRTDLTKEYQKAVTTFDFSYSTLKRFARNSLAYSFLPGEALWSDAEYLNVNPACEGERIGGEPTSTSCQTLLKTSEKAERQWDLERRYIAFESRF